MSGFESVVGINPWTALFTFLNMMITFFLLKKFLFKPVKNMIQNRQNEIDAMYSDAERSGEEAKALKAKYEESLADAKQERDDILRSASILASKREQEIIAAANTEAQSIRKKAEEDIAQEKKKALNDVKNEISGIAMEIASKVCEKEINEADHQALVEEFISNLGEER